jgi:uncharacterized protein (DUF885 family)
MNNELDLLAREFWDWRILAQPVISDDIPRVDRPANWDPDWSQTSIEAQRHQLQEFEERWKALDLTQASISRQVDHRLIGSAIARVRWEMDVLKSWQCNPRFYVYQTLGSLFEILLKNKPFDQERSEDIIKCLRRFPRFIDQGIANLKGNCIRPFAVATLEVIRDFRSQLTSMASELKSLLVKGSADELDEVIQDAILSLETFTDWLNNNLDSMSEDSAAGRDAYVYFLKNVALIPYTPEQLLSMGKQEWERSMTFEAFAHNRAINTAPLSVFSDELTQRGAEEQEEKKIRQFLEDNNILSVPTWLQHYVNLPMPAYVEPLAHLGVVDDLTSPERLNENGFRYIPPPSENLGYFELSSARDPRPLIVHEGVPGHYFQMSIAWAHENFIRRYYYDSGPNEGIGFYAEEMMLQCGLFDDSPRVREIIYNFMRLRALRVEVDIKLALGLFDIDQATDYLQTRTPMDRGTARAEAIFFATLPGQAITYQIGKIQLVKFLAEARQMQGEKFNLREFHDYVWKNGNIPFSLLRWELLGLKDEIEMLDQ